MRSTCGTFDCGEFNMIDSFASPKRCGVCINLYRICGGREPEAEKCSLINPLEVERDIIPGADGIPILLEISLLWD